MNNWQEATLRDIITLNYGKSLVETERKVGDILVYGSSGVTGKNDKAIVNEEGLIIGRKGNVGSIFRSNVPFFPIDTVFYIKKSETKCDFDYLYYLLKTLHLETLNYDSVVPGLNRDAAYDLSIFIPSTKEEQKSMANVLSGLDDKIELLEEQNKTLEKIAQTIFKEWFVNFNFPDKNGEPYAASGGKMIDSALGLIPEGWSVGDIYRYTEISVGFPFKSEMFNNEKKGLPLIRIRDLKDGSPEIYTDEACADNYIIFPGDILAGMDAEFRAVVWSGKKALLNQRVCRFRPKDNIGHYFILENIRPHLNFYEKTKFGTTVSHLGKADLDAIETIIPDFKIVDVFSKATEPIYNKLISNNFEVRTLSKLRDTLLTKLMSGELRV
jgi:type I restriction enzyme, S subunit